MIRKTGFTLLKVDILSKLFVRVAVHGN